jgi:TRAP-type C4-dicarboxylate transport system permease small subunit
MTGRIRKLGKYLDKGLSAIIAICFYMGLVCLGITAIVIMIDTIGRMFGFTGISSIELTGYMLVAVAFLPAAYTVRQGLFMTTDVVTKKLSSSAQKILRWVTDTITFIVSIFMLWSCLELTVTLYSGKMRSSTVLAPPLYLPQLPTTIGMSLFVIVMGIMIFQNIFSRGQWRKGK